MHDNPSRKLSAHPQQTHTSAPVTLTGGGGRRCGNKKGEWKREWKREWTREGEWKRERERRRGVGWKGHRHTHRGGDTVEVSVSVCDKRVTREMHGCQADEGAR